MLTTHLVSPLGRNHATLERDDTDILKTEGRSFLSMTRDMASSCLGGEADQGGLSLSVVNQGESIGRLMSCTWPMLVVGQGISHLTITA